MALGCLSHMQKASTRVSLRSPCRLTSAATFFACNCYGRPLLHAWLLPDLNSIPNNDIREILLISAVIVLAFRPAVPASNSARILYFCYAFVYLFLCFFVTDFVRKIVDFFNSSDGFSESMYMVFRSNR